MNTVDADESTDLAENLFQYVFLPPLLWEDVKRRLGKEMIEGVHSVRGPYLQEANLRYVKRLVPIPFGNERPFHVR